MTGSKTEIYDFGKITYKPDGTRIVENAPADSDAFVIVGCNVTKEGENMVVHFVYVLKQKEEKNIENSPSYS